MSRLHEDEALIIVGSSQVLSGLVRLTGLELSVPKDYKLVNQR